MKILISALVFSFLLNGNSFCQWSTNPILITDASPGGLVDLAQDGNGGAYLCYSSLTFPSPSPALVHIDKLGYWLWSQPKIFVKETWNGWQSHGRMEYDAKNNNIFTSVTEITNMTGWPPSGGQLEVWVNKLDANGNPLWGVNGLEVTLDINRSSGQIILPDKNGGCFVYFGKELIAGSYDYYACFQHFDSLGNRLFGNSGLFLLYQNQPFMFDSSSEQLIPTEDGCIVLTSYAAVRINASGIVWSVSQATSVIGAGCFPNRASSDGKNGIVSLGVSPVNNQQTPVAIRINEAGNYSFPNNYTVLDSIGVTGEIEYKIFDVQMTSDKNFFVYWNFIYDAWGNSLHRIQKIDSAGNLVGNNFFPSLTDTNKTGIGILSSSNDTYFCFWYEREGFQDFEIFLQKIDKNGNKLLIDNGINISNLNGLTGSIKIVPDNSGGAIVAWITSYSPYYPVYIQHISRHGNLGEILNDYGDVNENGVLDSLDAVLVLNSVTGLDTLTQNQFEVADVDGNGKVNVEDASLIIKKIKNLINDFPVHLLEKKIADNI